METLAYWINRSNTADYTIFVLFFLRSNCTRIMATRKQLTIFFKYASFFAETAESKLGIDRDTERAQQFHPANLYFLCYLSYVFLLLTSSVVARLVFTEWNVDSSKFVRVENQQSAPILRWKEKRQRTTIVVNLVHARQGLRQSVELWQAGQTLWLDVFGSMAAPGLL